MDISDNQTKRNRVLFGAILVVLLSGAIIAFGVLLYQAVSERRSAQTEIEASTKDKDQLMLAYTVDRVVDGDTIEVSRNGVKLRIRYIGVDTPETVKPNSPVECYGKEASNYNKSLVEKRQVYLEQDVQARDTFGRELRYVYMRDSGGNTFMVNKKLVEDGYAVASAYPPNVKYQDDLEDAERSAREQSRGLWAKCELRSGN
jgi:micrococcal nuclease